MLQACCGVACGQAAVQLGLQERHLQGSKHSRGLQVSAPQRLARRLGDKQNSRTACYQHVAKRIYSAERTCNQQPKRMRFTTC
jgi:hypothetical protein